MDQSETSIFLSSISKAFIDREASGMLIFYFNLKGGRYKFSEKLRESELTYTKLAFLLSKIIEMNVLE